MKPLNVEIELISPLFSYGAENRNPARPEIRVPSIRGMLRWWPEALLGERDVIDLWGGAEGDSPRASQIVVRVEEVQRREARQNLLPHPCGHQSPKNCIDPGTRFRLMFGERPGRLKLSQEQEGKFKRVVKAWLLMGALGGRSNRGAGSFKWTCDGLQGPSSEEDYARAIRELLIGCPLQAALLPGWYDRSEAARIVASDTISGGCGNNALGSISPKRIPSPLKFRIVAVDGRFGIIALWDGRGRANLGRRDLEVAITALERHPKPIGKALKDSGLYLWARAR